MSLGGPALFKEEKSGSSLSNSELHNTGLWKCVMAQTKEISEDLRRRVVDAHQAGKGYKTISKEFGLKQLTVRQIVYKLRTSKTTVTLPRRGRPPKITPRADV